MLNDIEFTWNPKEAKWNDRIEDLKTFQMQDGHVDVLEDANSELFAWLQRQREHYFTGSLNEKKINCLASLGVSLECNANTNESDQPTTRTSSWDNQYNDLKEYSISHGNCLVPQHYKPDPRLGLFVKNQRRQYKLMKMEKKSSMTQERMHKLASIGFVWNSHEYIDLEEVIEIPVRQALKRSLDKRRAAMSPRMMEENAELLMASYKRISLWGR